MKGVRIVMGALCLGFSSVVAAQAVEGTLVLYTSQPERDVTQTVAAFSAQHPGVKVEVFRSGTTEVMAKLAAEFAAGQAQPDLLLIADAASMESLKKDQRLLAYPEAQVAQLAAGSYDADKTYFATKLITTGIAVHSDAKLKPTRWADLTGPDYKGAIAMPSPLYSGAAAIMLASVTSHDDLGWQFYEGLKANSAIAVRGNGAVLNAVAGGERTVGVLVDYMAFNAKAKGSPVEFVFPAEGNPAVTEPVAILSTTKNAPAARAFVDFLLSTDGQALAAKMGYIPARTDVAGPEWLPAGVTIKLMPTDIPRAVADNAANLKRFEQIFAQ